MTTSSSCPAELKIRRLNKNDLRRANELRASVGWNQTKEDWLRLLEYDAQGCFAALWENSLVGTVTTTRYGPELAWVGMVLVDSEYRGRKIGAALMRNALSFLQETQVRCIQLDATPIGKALYVKLGFQEQWSFHRWERQEPPQADAASESSQAEQPGFQWLVSQTNLDRVAFGANRYEWLQRLAGDSVVAGNAEGFAMRRAGEKSIHLGPVTAANPTIARQLIESLLNNTTGSVIWDIPGPNLEAEAIASSLGFKPTRTLTRMSIGELRPLANPLLQFAMSDPATG